MQTEKALVGRLEALYMAVSDVGEEKAFIDEDEPQFVLGLKSMRCSMLEDHQN